MVKSGAKSGEYERISEHSGTFRGVSEYFRMQGYVCQLVPHDRATMFCQLLEFNNKMYLSLNQSLLVGPMIFTFI